MNAKLISIALVLLVFYSCNRNSKTLFLKVDSAEGLTTKSVVSINGLEIGIVIRDIFKGLTGAGERDSILIELRRLNANLEELNEAGEKNNKNE